MFDNPQQVLREWLDGINAAEVHRAVALYAENAVLLPTFSNKTLTAASDKETYFERLAGYSKLSVELHERTLMVQNLSARLFLMSGIYLWRFEIEGELLSFEARFTMAVDLDQPCPIIHQHSSQIPRML